MADFAARVRTALAAEDYEAAARLVDASSTPAARVLAAGLAELGRGPAAVQHTIRGATALLRVQLERGMWRAAAVAVVAVLLGVLGHELGFHAALPAGLAVAALATMTFFVLRVRVREALATTEALAGVLLAQLEAPTNTR
jgi:biopolymer transport protein ExbB/TolQ